MNDKGTREITRHNNNKKERYIRIETSEKRMEIVYNKNFATAKIKNGKEWDIFRLFISSLRLMVYHL